MRHRHQEKLARNVLAFSISLIGITMPVAAIADLPNDEVLQLITPESEIELGAGKVSRDSFKFGDYTGLNKSDLHGIVNFHIVNRDKESARYYEIIGRNLGLDSRTLSIEGGQQGNYDLRFDYGELPKLHTDSYQTPYLGAGTTRLTQPAGITDGANPAAMAGLAANMQSFDVKTKRQTLGLGLTKLLPAGWDIAFNYKRENRDGTKLTAGVIQIGAGGSRGAVILPEPVDYTTDQFEAVARFADEKMQLQVGYYGSIFKNANESLTWDNLYTGTGNTTGRYGLPPDNQFHQINASGGYAISKDTRLTGALSYGNMTQNESFLPYSTGGFMPATASLNGKVIATHASLKLKSRLAPKLNLTAGYRYDDRDNRTPVNQYDYYTADRDAGGTGTATNALRRWNTPLSSTKQGAHAELDYHWTHATKLKAGYDYHHVKHTHEPTNKDQEHTVKAEVHHRFNEQFSGGLGYAYSDRKASTYFGAAPMDGTYSSGYMATLCDAGNSFSYQGVSTACTGAGTGRTYPWLEAPPLRKYFLADRKRDKLRAFADFSPTDRLDLQFGVDYKDDRYPDSEAGFGLVGATGWAANVDASLRVSDAVSGFAFATLEEYRTDQQGANISGAAQTTGAEQNTLADTQRWLVSTRDRIFTMGIGFRVKPGGKYELGGDFIHSYANGRTSFNAGTGVTTAPLPDLISRLNRLELFGKYWLQKNLALNVRYVHERFSSADWAWDSPLGLTSSANVVGTNMTSPNYKVHAIGASIAYRFQ